MLSYDIRDVQQHAVRVDGSLPADDPIWEDGDPRPAGPLHATGRLSAAGAGRFYWSGRIAATADVACRRCLEPFAAPIADEVHALFAEAGDSVEDPDVFPLPPGAQVVDLRAAIREQWLLSVPTYALCRDDCKGLCPRCGTDLNLGVCTCSAQPDRRWDALRTSRSGSE